MKNRVIKYCQDNNIEVEIQKEDIDKLLKEYKKLKKYSKSSMHEIERLSGKKTKIEKCIQLKVEQKVHFWKMHTVDKYLSFE